MLEFYSFFFRVQGILPWSSSVFLFLTYEILISVKRPVWKKSILDKTAICRTRREQDIAKISKKIYCWFLDDRTINFLLCRYIQVSRLPTLLASIWFDNLYNNCAFFSSCSSTVWVWVQFAAAAQVFNFPKFWHLISANHFSVRKKF